MKRLIASLTFLLCAGCGQVATHNKNEALTDTLTAYANALRWGDFEQALTFIDADTLKQHPVSSLDKERYKQVHVTSYNERPTTPAGGGDVQQVVEISVINVNTQTERTLIDRQLWRYEEKTKHWHNVSGLPDITQH